MAEKQHNITVDADDILYYVDYDLMNVYVNKNNQSDVKVGNDPIALANPDIYIFDETLTQIRFDRFKEKFIAEMQKRYKSLKTVDKTVKGVKHLLANDMFIIAFEDNNWSVGVELLHNPKCKNPNLRGHLLPPFKKGMRDILLDLVGEIHTRTGSWSTEIIDKTKAKAMDNAEKNKNTTAVAPANSTNVSSDTENKTVNQPEPDTTPNSATKQTESNQNEGVS